MLWSNHSPLNSHQLTRLQNHPRPGKINHLIRWIPDLMASRHIRLPIRTPFRKERMVAVR
jgi:hypothetical protein